MLRVAPRPGDERYAELRTNESVWADVEAERDRRSLTATRRDLPLHGEVEPGTSGLDEVGYAKCEDIKSISIERLVHRLGTGGYDVVHRLRRVLDHLLEV